MKVCTLAFSLSLVASITFAQDNQTKTSSTDASSSSVQRGSEENVSNANTNISQQTPSSGETIALESAPPIVQQRIRTQAALMPLKSLTKSMQGGQPVYEATFVGKNAKTVMQLSEEGRALGMNITSSAPVVYGQATPSRTPPQPIVTTTTEQTATGPQQANVPTPAPTATQTTVPAEQPGAVVQTTAPVPNVTDTRNASQMPTESNPPIQFQEAAGAQAPAQAEAQGQVQAQLPAQVQNMVQQQIGNMQIESTRPIIIYQINARDQNGQMQSFWTDETGRLIK